MMPLVPDAPRVPSFEDCIEMDKEILDRPFMPKMAEEPATSTYDEENITPTIEPDEQTEEQII